MLSFFSSPDVSKLRQKAKNNEPVQLQNIVWNSDLKLDKKDSTIKSMKNQFKSNSTSIELLRQHSSVSTLDLAERKKHLSNRGSTDSWISNQETGTFWFLRKKRSSSSDRITKSQSSLYEHKQRRKSQLFSEIESESSYNSKSAVNLFTRQDKVNNDRNDDRKYSIKSDDEPNYLTMASITTVIDKDDLDKDTVIITDQIDSTGDSMSQSFEYKKCENICEDKKADESGSNIENLR